ncbi:MAG TPA: serine protease, partial [Thermoguttaceae bacterium]|nr:serine protease [Thermoguttaceae bacterium]
MQTLDADGARSFGSGAAIAYHGRIVVFTASHVVRDARRVWVRDTAGRWHAAGVVARSEWDVALLQPFGEGPFVPAKLAYRASESDAAGTVFRPGDRLDSCGFGPDDRLAVNHGTFLRYARRNPADTVTDWLVLTGAARQGDSGGPVFNSRGELVGILWGTDGRTVVATQCGRLHVVLREAMGDEGREAGDEESVTGNRAASCDLNSGGPRS